MSEPPCPRRGLRRARLLRALALVALLAGCSDIFSRDYRYGTIRVEVVDLADNPVPGVDLVLYTGVRHMGYGATGADGRHTFRFVPFGAFGVYAGPPEGYGFPRGQREFVLVELGEGEEAEVRFRLEARPGAASARGSAGAP